MNVSSWVGVCFFFKQKTAYEMRISDWSSDVCSSDLIQLTKGPHSKDFSSDAILHQLFEKSQVIAMLLLTAHRGHRHDVGGRVDRRSMMHRTVHDIVGGFEIEGWPGDRAVLVFDEFPSTNFVEDFEVAGQGKSRKN